METMPLIGPFSLIALMLVGVIGARDYLNWTHLQRTWRRAYGEFVSAVEHRRVRVLPMRLAFARLAVAFFAAEFVFFAERRVGRPSEPRLLWLVVGIFSMQVLLWLAGLRSELLGTTVRDPSQLPDDPAVLRARRDEAAN